MSRENMAVVVAVESNDGILFFFATRLTSQNCDAAYRLYCLHCMLLGDEKYTQYSVAMYITV